MTTRVMGTQGYAAPEYMATGNKKRALLFEKHVSTSFFILVINFFSFIRFGKKTASVIDVLNKYILIYI